MVISFHCISIQEQRPLLYGRQLDTNLISSNDVCNEYRETQELLWLIYDQLRDITAQHLGTVSETLFIQYFIPTDWGFHWIEKIYTTLHHRVHNVAWNRKYLINVETFLICVWGNIQDHKGPLSLMDSCRKRKKSWRCISCVYWRIFLRLFQRIFCALIEMKKRKVREFVWVRKSTSAFL